MKMNWTGAAHQLNKQGKAYVIATIVGVTGSTPRNSGTKMVITHNDIFDTIGGGHLEHKAIKHAHQLLITGDACQQIEHFQLGAQLGQCCGGNATVLFECFKASGANIMLFGAGHVGKALIPILGPLLLPLITKRLILSHKRLGALYNIIYPIIINGMGISIIGIISYYINMYRRCEKISYKNLLIKWIIYTILTMTLFTVCFLIVLYLLNKYYMWSEMKEMIISTIILSMFSSFSYSTVRIMTANC